MDIAQLTQENIRLSEELDEICANIHDTRQKLITLCKDHVFDIIVSYNLSGDISAYKVNQHLPIELDSDIVADIIRQLRHEGKLIWRNCRGYAALVPAVEAEEKELAEKVQTLINLKKERELL